MQDYFKKVIIISMVLWVFLFCMDLIIGIDWPSQTSKRAFIWFPTVAIGLFWLIFGGNKKDKKQE